MSNSWTTLVADKLQRQRQSIPPGWEISVPPNDVLDVTSVAKDCGSLSRQELKITGIEDVEELLHKLASGELSSVSVTMAFYKRAIIAHQLTNCLTEIFVERALHRAAELDEYLQTTGQTVGALHGLPISLKDQISMEGLETIMGYVSGIGKYSEHDAVLVQILYDCGAVPFVRTNVPQTIMWAETLNNIFGRTTNPYNRSLTSGGSSGGEAALIALKGSILGVGSDIGGSVRSPAAFCGIYGLRPSYGRVPYEGTPNSFEGQDSVLSVLGPMSRSLSGIKVFMKAIADSKPWQKDPLAVRKPWNEEEYNLLEHGHGKELCFGIIWADGVVVPHPPILRALKQTKSALVAAGHKVIDWVPINHLEMNTLIRAIWGSGAFEDITVATSASGEPLLTSTSLLPDSDGQTPHPFKGAQTSAYKLWQLHKRKRELRKEYLDLWEKTIEVTETGRPIDAIIAPVAPYAAPPHGMNKISNYTRIWSLLDYPALALPVTKVNPAIDLKAPPHQFLCDLDKEHYDLYDPNVFVNAPVAVQLVGRTLEEEALIGIGEVVDAALRAIPTPV
ncbi:hypothetical protein JAAARDRAFT_148343 [Jaapia argillacea MUCL 33604]|uniref:amidase n=1 Tax=Jaapia argillacea MUCL 33604 TaxID=933084 RepID=A0A067QJL8_9AGAM|nr:hypothetical protein JAAARDRAFT_148343 [Jaapia argillacea MUCL 33604]